jgi:hypothetical protein
MSLNNFLNKRTSWKNSELWLYKLAVFFCGLAVGAYFNVFLSAYMAPLATLATLGAIAVAVLWLRKLRGK